MTTQTLTDILQKSGDEMERGGVGRRGSEVLFA